MNYQRVVSATMESQSVSTADDPLIEVQIPASVFAEIIRVEVGPSEGADPVAEVQELALYSATGAGTGGSALTERLINGSGTIQGAALRNLTAVGAGSAEWYHTAYHAYNGWLYLPVPEERYQSVTGSQDNFGILFPVAPDAAMTLSATIVWGEVG